MKNYRTLAVAVACALASTASLVTMSTAQTAGQSTDRTSAQSGQTGGISSGSAADGSRAGEGADTADRQMLQTLQQIAQSPENAPDKLFVLMVAAGNQWETEFSRVVQEKVQDQQVKDLAKRCIKSSVTRKMAASRSF